jgi:nitrous oxide reductase accessory protein NosL
MNKSLLIAAAVTVALAACGKEAPKPTPAPSTSSTPAPSTAPSTAPSATPAPAAPATPAPSAEAPKTEEKKDEAKK